MANDVLARQGGTVNLSGLRAPEIPAFSGSEGRVAVASTVPTNLLKDFGNIIEGVVKAKNKIGEDAAAAEQRKITHEAALAEANLRFAIGTDAPVDMISQIATMSREQRGIDPPPEVLERLDKLDKNRKQLETALSQLDPADRESRLELAMIAQRTAFLEKYPEWGVEALVASGKLPVQEMSARFSEFNRQVQEEAAEKRDMLTALRARGVRNVSVDIPLEQVRELYDQKVAPVVAQAERTARTLAELRGKGDILTEQDRLRRISATRSMRSVRMAEVTAGIRAIQDLPIDGIAKAERLGAFKSGLLKEISDTEGIFDPTQLQQEYGTLLGMVDLAKDQALDKTRAEGLGLALDITQRTADLQISEKYGAVVVRELEGFIGRASALLGPAFQADLLSKPNGPVDQVVRKFIGATSATIAGDDEPAGIYPRGVADWLAPDGRPGGLSAKREAEKAVAGINRQVVENYQSIPKEDLPVHVGYFVKTVNDPYLKSNVTAWGDLIDVMDSPNFKSFAKATGIDKQIGAQAAVNTNRYANQLLLAVSNVERQAGISLEYDEASFQKDGSLVVTPESMSRLTPEQRDTVVRSTRRLNQAARVLSNTFGDAPSPAEAMVKLYNRASERANNAR